MSQIPVGESVRAVLQPDDKRMDFRDRADQRMMDVRVHGNGRYKQAQCCIDTVSPRNNEPCRMECPACLSIVVILAVVRIPCHSADSSFGLLSCCELDDVGYEEMTGHESIEHSSKK